MSSTNETNLNFIFKEIEKDLSEGVYSEVHTRFPPEPNGCLHIGNAYAINISHSAALRYGGKFNLRFDDTNPVKEEVEYVESIVEDMKWMGFYWEDRLFYGSDYFDKIYEYALKLIKNGKAYVCDLSQEEIREYRGTLTEPGRESPYRNRSIEENLSLFKGMKMGEFPVGSRVLRAKIDMASPNLNMRDPVIYRIHFAEHYRTGDAWCIYPMYDYAHPIQDAIEGITHSLCSLEFKDHRPLYEWVLRELEIENPPKQREFGRMNLSGAVTSKRYLRQLVLGGYLDGWDDPRLLTLKGLRRRGYTPGSIKKFFDEVGILRSDNTIDIAMLEHSLREDIKQRVPCVMAVLRPLKVVITNYPEGQVEYLDMQNNGENSDLGSRSVPFSKVIFIEREDFMEAPPKGYHRLFPGNEVRLKGAYIIKCEEIIKDETTGETLEIRCSYDPETKSGGIASGRKVKGTIHWVSAAHGIKAEVRLYDRLLKEGLELDRDVVDWTEYINPDSLVILKNCFMEPFLAGTEGENRFQFMRQGYFCVDNRHSSGSSLVFNRIVPLKDSWNRREKA